MERLALNELALNPDGRTHIRVWTKTFLIFSENSIIEVKCINKNQKAYYEHTLHEVIEVKDKEKIK